MDLTNPKLLNCKVANIFQCLADVALSNIDCVCFYCFFKMQYLCYLLCQIYLVLISVDWRYPEIAGTVLPE